MAERIFHNGLPTSMNLRKKGVKYDVGCVFCGKVEEDARHLFMECWWAKALWCTINIIFSETESVGRPREWLWTVFETRNLLEIRKFLVGIWAIWTNRNLILQNWLVHRPV